MEKLLKFVHYAYIACIALAIVDIVFSVVSVITDESVRDKFLLISEFTKIIRDILLVSIFMIIIISSARTSPLKIPSGIISGALALDLLYSAGYSLSGGESIGLSTPFHPIACILFCAGLIWLSLFFKKGSAVRKTGFMLAVAPIVLSVIEIVALNEFISVDEDFNFDVSNTGYLIIMIIKIIMWICIILFLRFFSRLGKQAGN